MQHRPWKYCPRWAASGSLIYQPKDWGRGGFVYSVKVYLGIYCTSSNELFGNIVALVDAN